MPGPRDYTPRTVKKLYALASNSCTNPECRGMLVVAGKKSGKSGQLGKIAHIRSAEQTSARYDTSMTDDQRRAFENLILLCPDLLLVAAGPSQALPLSLCKLVTDVLLHQPP